MRSSLNTTFLYCYFSHRRWMTLWMHKWSKYRIICSQQEFCPPTWYMRIGTVGIMAYRNITLLHDPVQYKLHARAKGCMYDVHCTWSNSKTNSHNSRKLQMISMMKFQRWLWLEAYIRVTNAPASSLLCCGCTIVENFFSIRMRKRRWTFLLGWRRGGILCTSPGFLKAKNYFLADESVFSFSLDERHIFLAWIN